MSFDGEVLILAVAVLGRRVRSFWDYYTFNILLRIRMFDRFFKCLESNSVL